jgi:ATP:ADP antiporter, AAA family
MLLSAALLGAGRAAESFAERIVPEGSRAAHVEHARGREQPHHTGARRLHTVARSGYLLRIALFVMLLNLVNTNGTYILAASSPTHAAAVAASVGTR